MQKQRIILIIGAVLALLAVFMVKLYLDQQRQAISEQERKRLEKMRANQSTVVVAKKDIPAGATIDSEMVETENILNKDKEARAVPSSERAEGAIASVLINRGEQITLDKISYIKQASGLAEVTPVGKRAVTISVDNIAALAGMIRPGNYADVIGAIPVPMQTSEGKQVSQVAVLPLFQNVLVLAVGQDTSPQAQSAASRYSKKEEKKEISPFITLALSPQEANFMAFVQEQGKIRLVLRSPADTQVQPVQPANWDSLFQYILPPRKEPPKQEEKEYIEIYRGLNKEKIILSK